MKYVRVRLEPGGPCFVSSIDDLDLEALFDGEPSDTGAYLITQITMTDESYKNLPDFDGF